jgi:hypothetical protein
MSDVTLDDARSEVVPKPARGSLRPTAIGLPSPLQGVPQRAERRWLAMVVVATVVLTEIPFLLAYGQEACGFAFTGMLWSPHDFAQYAAAMRDGAASSSWLIHDRLTAEPHRPVLMYPFYVGLGKLAAMLRLDFQLAFHAAALAARSVLLIVIYVFTAAIFPSVGERRRAFLLVLFSSGLAFWLLMLDAAVPFMGDRRSLFTLDLQLPDVTTFLALFLAPHHLLGLALLLLAARVYLASWTHPGRHLPVLTGLAVLGLGLVNPFSLVTLCVILPVHAALAWLTHRQLPLVAALCVGAAFLAAAPFVSYSWLVFGADPFWSLVYGQQNFTPSPPPPFLALSLAPVLALAAVGLPRFSRGRSPERTLILVWVVASLALMYAPVGYQRRFAFGIHTMLALIAAAGLAPFWSRADTPARRGKHFLTLGLLLALFGTTACSYGLRLQAASRPEDVVRQGGAFHPVSLEDAAHWLAPVMEPGDVILSLALTGNYLATVVPGRVFIGHPIATLQFADKEASVHWFYRQGDGQHARQQFLADNSIRYVVYGPYERAAGASPSTSHENLRLVYATSDVSIFEVREAARR